MRQDLLTNSDGADSEWVPDLHNVVLTPDLRVLNLYRKRCSFSPLIRLGPMSS